MDPPISSGASVHLIKRWEGGRNVTRFSSSGFSLGSHLVINKGCLLRCTVFPARVCCRIFEFLRCMAIFPGFNLTEEPIGCPGIILKSQIFIFGMGR